MSKHHGEVVCWNMKKEASALILLFVLLLLQYFYIENLNEQLDWILSSNDKQADEVFFILYLKIFLVFSSRFVLYGLCGEKDNSLGNSQQSNWQSDWRGWKENPRMTLELMQLVQPAALRPFVVVWVYTSVIKSVAIYISVRFDAGYFEQATWIFSILLPASAIFTPATTWMMNHLKAHWCIVIMGAMSLTIGLISIVSMIWFMNHSPLHALWDWIAIQVGRHDVPSRHFTDLS